MTATDQERDFGITMDGTHNCPGRHSANVELPAGVAMCASCWATVPRPLRKRIYVAHSVYKRTSIDKNLAWLRRAQLEAVMALLAPARGAL